MAKVHVSRTSALATNALGPEVYFIPLSKELLGLQAAHGQFNILHPASIEEVEALPSAAILGVSIKSMTKCVRFGL